MFGIDADGNEQDEKKSAARLSRVHERLRSGDRRTRRTQHPRVRPAVYFSALFGSRHSGRGRLSIFREFHVRGVFDTMHHWWLGAKRFVSLDDIAWALGIESSKTADGGRQQSFRIVSGGKLAEIREYNLNDVRVTRKVYERMVGVFGTVIMSKPSNDPKFS